MIVTFFVIATSSVGFAATTTSDASITGGFWNEIVSAEGTIAIDTLIINITNTSIEKYRKYHTCAQFTLTNGTFGDIACVNSTSLSPSPQQGSSQNFLQIDFVKKVQEKNKGIQKSFPKIGRNDPCSCGSGKKFKICHGI